MKTTSSLISQLQNGQNIRIVAYGTSLTEGGSWVNDLKIKCDLLFPQQTTVINSGGSGQWSKWGVENLKDKVLSHRPDIVFIEFAVNDSVTRFQSNVREAKNNLEFMINQILLKNNSCEIILMTMTPADKHPIGHRSHRTNIEDYYEMYRAVAKQKNLLLIDFYPIWKSLQQSNPALYEQYMPDGIHPTDEGNTNIMVPHLFNTLGLI